MSQPPLPPMRRISVPASHPTPPPPGGTAASFTPKKIQRGPLKSKLPPRILLYAVEGWGKTTLAAHAPEPIILMAPGEDGYLTLLGQGRVPEVARVELETWRETIATLDYVIGHPDECKSVALDGLARFEALCHQKVCDEEYQGEWGEKGFAAYGRGYEAAVREWLILLERLDRLRQLGKTILLLAHSEIRTYSNPLGPDFDQYILNLHRKTWAATKPWPDMVLFGTTVSVVTKEKGKAKGIGGTDRVLHTSLTDGFYAKNRHGLPAEILMPEDPSQLWSTLSSAIEGAAS